ncbi:MAG: hypothetical protein J6C85_03890 [Alphaproteobacteria bacterium]|nr:hypothetical protein [Alphaproteobacteria bacterium]
MSEAREKNITQKKPRFKALKWTGIVLGVVFLELGAIAASVKFIEFQNKKEQNRLENISEQLTAQNTRLAVLEKLPASVSANSKQISSNFNTLTNLLQELNQLRDEVGHNKLETINQKITSVSSRIESLEESKSLEALVLSLALIIKENTLYHRPFAKEAEILTNLTQGNENISADVKIINRFKDTSVADDYELADRFMKFKDDLSFTAQDNSAEQTSETSEKSTISRSIELIKDTVAGINFDKVVVLKKDKKTGEQKLLLTMLENLVKSHNFTDALKYIQENPEFANIKTPAFRTWQQEVTEKLEFDRAVSKLIASQLSSLRQEISQNNVTLPEPASAMQSENVEKEIRTDD